MTKLSRKARWRVKKLIFASMELAFKGANTPEAQAEIEDAFDDARQKLEEYILELEVKASND